MVRHYDKEIMADAEEEEAEKVEGEEGEIEQPIVMVSVMEYFMQELESLTFENGIYEKLKGDFFEEFRKKGSINMNNYLAHRDSAISSLVSTLLIGEEMPSPNWKKKGIFVPDLDGNLLMGVKSPLWHYERKKIEKLMKESLEKMKTEMTADEERENDEIFAFLLAKKKEIDARIGIEGAVA